MAEFWLGDSNGPMGDVGAFMGSELRVDRADLAGHIRQLGDDRVIVALVGVPGSGCPGLAAELAERLSAGAPGSVAVLTLESFAQRPGPKAGPDEHDIAALLEYLAQLAATPCGTACGPVPAEARVILIENPYLLLTRPLWRDLCVHFDLSIRQSRPEHPLAPEAELHAQTMLAENRAADLVIFG